MHGVAPPATADRFAAGWAGALRDAILVVVGTALVGLAFNALRANGIPLVATTAYEILVPCPETLGEAEAWSADDPRLTEPTTLIIDARSRAEVESWHWPTAISVVFDYLEPVAPEVLRELSGSGAQRIVVYGSGAEPDSGEELAKELSGRGLRNVGFVRGGAAALRAAAARSAP